LHDGRGIGRDAFERDLLKAPDHAERDDEHRGAQVEGAALWQGVSGFSHEFIESGSSESV